jgi:hypothetical protein
VATSLKKLIAYCGSAARGQFLNEVNLITSSTGHIARSSRPAGRYLCKLHSRLMGFAKRHFEIDFVLNFSIFGMTLFQCRRSVKIARSRRLGSRNEDVGHATC